jgi:hypothetical protein
LAPSVRVRFWVLIAAAWLAAVTVLPSRAGAGPPGGNGSELFGPDWSAIEPVFFPLSPALPEQPVLTAADVSDAPAYFVADPFLIHTPALWHMFFEVTVPMGRIAHATSLDGLKWKYQSIVLVEPFQLSYPSVFEFGGEYWMTPESATQNAVRLYRADPFPDSWTFVADLTTGRAFADPQLFRYGGRWWMFVGNAGSDMCWLYSSETLEAGWTEHPLSPLIAGNRGRARPGGRAVVLSGDRLFRLAQNASPTYGRALRVFQVDVLTPTAYFEHEVPESPILQATGLGGWNSDGMHQCDPWWVGDHWLAAVDGLWHSSWSIGIYRTASIATGAPFAEVRPGVRLECAPNPFVVATELGWETPARTARLCIYDPAGRLLLSRTWRRAPGERGRFTWDGTDAAGRPVAAGIYYCELRAGEQATTTRVVRMR